MIRYAIARGKRKQRRQIANERDWMDYRMGKAVKPQPTEETDYLVTARRLPAGKPDTDLEIAAPILTDPKTHELRAAR